MPAIAEMIACAASFRMLILIDKTVSPVFLHEKHQIARTCLRPCSSASRSSKDSAPAAFTRRVLSMARI